LAAFGRINLKLGETIQRYWRFRSGRPMSMALWVKTAPKANPRFSASAGASRFLPCILPVGFRPAALRIVGAMSTEEAGTSSLPG
jgi:hypothetical protein